jgi:hypothetical protein
VTPEAPTLRMAGAARPGEEWQNGCNLIDALCGGRFEREPSDVPTIPEFALEWTSGAPAKRWPDHVKDKKSSDREEQRFRLYINPILRTVRLDRFTLDHADAVMASLPWKLRPATRRTVASQADPNGGVPWQVSHRESDAVRVVARKQGQPWEVAPAPVRRCGADGVRTG